MMPKRRLVRYIYIFVVVYALNSKSLLISFFVVLGL